jgi:hypothetical protein
LYSLQLKSVKKGTLDAKPHRHEALYTKKGTLEKFDAISRIFMGG